MPACPKCSGMLKIPTMNHGSGPGILYLDCDCTQTETPGRVPHQRQIHYPPEVLRALQQAGQAQRDALEIQGLTHQHLQGG